MVVEDGTIEGCFSLNTRWQNETEPPTPNNRITLEAENVGIE